MYILIYLRILKLYYHILDKGDGRSGKESLLLKLKQVIAKLLICTSNITYKQFGNSVVIDVLQLIGEEIGAVLERSVLERSGL